MLTHTSAVSILTLYSFPSVTFIPPKSVLAQPRPVDESDTRSQGQLGLHGRRAGGAPRRMGEAAGRHSGQCHPVLLAFGN